MRRDGRQGSVVTRGHLQLWAEKIKLFLTSTSKLNADLCIIFFSSHLCAQTRQNFGVVELDGLIYVLGGENEAMELTTVEVFDPHFSTWKPQTSMTMVRSVSPEEPRAQTEPPPGPGTSLWVRLDRRCVCRSGCCWNRRGGFLLLCTPLGSRGWIWSCGQVLVWRKGLLSVRQNSSRTRRCTVSDCDLLSLRWAATPP